MGRKSRRKKQRKSLEEHFQPQEQTKQAEQAGFARFLVEVVRWGAYIALFAPLVIHPSFFFPFVVPKTVFFWVFTEIIFAAWLLLAISNKQFRPRWNALSIAVAIFLLITVVTSFTGVNIGRSFWSTFERMAGAIHWIHLGLFFFAVSSTFRTAREWKKFLSASMIAAVLVAVVFLLQKFEIKQVIPFDTRLGSTIGNSSFMAAYLLFNFFFAGWLFVKAKELWQRIFYGVGLGIIGWTLLIATAYGALLSMIGGLFIIFLAWLFFAQKVPFSRPAAVLFLALGIAAGGIVTWATFTQYQPVISKLPYFFSAEGTVGARKIVWNKGWQGIKERPILGWGPENFNVVFTKYYNPCMPLSKCGGEIWFDRTHNIILDNLVHSGVIGLAAYLSIFIAALLMLWKRFLFTKDDLSRAEPRDWLLPSMITAVLASYFAQNLLVFDMLNTYLMFAFTLAFVAGTQSVSKKYAQEGGVQKTSELIRSTRGADSTKPESALSPSSDEAPSPRPSVNPRPASIVFVTIFLLYFLFSYGFQSLQAANWGIRINGASLDAETRLATYKKSLSVSPLGNRQIVEFFTNRVISWLNAGTRIPPEFMEEVGRVMEETAEQNSLDFRHHLLLGNFYNAARTYNSEYLTKAEETLKRAIELSPTNQQGYTALAQTYFYQGKEEESLEMLQKALALEPEYRRSRLNLADAYVISGKYEEAREGFEKLFDEGYTPGDQYHARIVETYEVLGEYEKAIEWQLKVVERSPAEAGEHFKLARLYQGAGQVEEAKAEAEKVRELDEERSEEVDNFLKELE